MRSFLMCVNYVMPRPLARSNFIGLDRMNKKSGAAKWHGLDKSWDVLNQLCSIRNGFFPIRLYRSRPTNWNVNLSSASDSKRTTERKKKLFHLDTHTATTLLLLCSRWNKFVGDRVNHSRSSRIINFHALYLIFAQLCWAMCKWKR